jgi:hypothetical protein
MHINDITEYYGMKEYAERLSSVLEDGRSFLRGDALLMFSVSVRTRLAEAIRAIEEFESSVGLHKPRFLPIEVRDFQVENGVLRREAPSINLTYSAESGQLRMIGQDVLLCGFEPEKSVRQLSLFMYVDYTSLTRRADPTILPTIPYQTAPQAA